LDDPPRESPELHRRPHSSCILTYIASSNLFLSLPRDLTTYCRAATCSSSKKSAVLHLGLFACLVFATLSGAQNGYNKGSSIFEGLLLSCKSGGRGVGTAGGRILEGYEECGLGARPTDRRGGREDPGCVFFWILGELYARQHLKGGVLEA
jgi:hypothetical protein